MHDMEYRDALPGVYRGKVVTVVMTWQDAKRQLHFSVRMPCGSINPDVHQDEISFDKNLIKKIAD